MIKSIHLYVLSALAISFSHTALADHNENVELDEVSVTAPVDSRIVNHPAAVETYTKRQIQDTVNATTSQQTLKYLPSFQVRERYIGDRNGPIATRTTGTLSSAQTILYADGVLLSNFLGNNFGFAPRWGLVSPEEIESVNILYGPFSALYPGNSFGGMVNLNTRMPTKFEAHASVQAFAQNYELYGTDKTYDGNHETFSAGNKFDDLSILFTADRLKSTGQPMQFANAVTTSAGGTRTAVTGAYLDKDPSGRNRVTFGATGIDHSEQLNLKLKAAYDITPTIKVAYTIGTWDLDSRLDVDSYIKDAAGNAVYNGRVTFNGQDYNVTGFNNPAEVNALHIMQALDLKSNTKGLFDWQLTLSDYDYQQDKSSASNVGANVSTAGANGGNPYVNRIGRITDLAGTGWTVFDARGTLRPKDGNGDQHTIDFGYHIDDYNLRSKVHDTADWSVGSKGLLNASSSGNTTTQAIYFQDKWQLDPKWAVTFGARQEHWEATDGQNQITAGTLLTSNYKDRSDNKFSPKLSVSFEPEPAWGFRASAGQAFRFPTVSELFQVLRNDTRFVQSNPDLKTEEVISAELTAERRFANGLVRASLFHENKYDALVSQTLSLGSAIPYDSGVCESAAGCNFIQNVGHIRTRGIEISTEWQDAFIHGLDLLASITLTDAEVLRNEASPNIEGNKPLRIPQSMIKAVATYHQGSNLTYSIAARYSGRQYNSLDNSDNNPDTFGGASKFFFVDVKANYKFADRFTASVGVDNLNNDKAYIFHPYPQRTGYVQLKFDY
jgi:iron complex outermembrane recepter protein